MFSYFSFLTSNRYKINLTCIMCCRRSPKALQPLTRRSPNALHCCNRSRPQTMETFAPYGSPVRRGDVSGSWSRGATYLSPFSSHTDLDACYESSGCTLRARMFLRENNAKQTRVSVSVTYTYDLEIEEGLCSKDPYFEVSQKMMQINYNPKPFSPFFALFWAQHLTSPHGNDVL